MPHSLPRHAAWLLTTLALAACAPGTSGTGPAKVPRKMVEPASTASRPPAYADVKATLQGMQEDGLTRSSSDVTTPAAAQENAGLEYRNECIEGLPCVLDLADCGPSGSEYLGGETSTDAERHLAGMADTAYEVIRLQAVLHKAGYPDASWRPQVMQFESESLRALADPAPSGLAAEPVDPEAWSEQPAGPIDELQESLRKTLSEYRTENDPSLPEVTIEGGCGAGDIGIHVATAPANGRSRFIPVFYYRLCKVRGVDPDDAAACDYWKEPADGVLFDVAGDYQYRVDWPDGARREGKFSFTNLEDGQTVTISKP